MKISRIIIFCLIFIIPLGNSCKKWQVIHKEKQDLRALRQKQRQQDTEKAQKYQEAVKRQASIQDKKTLKIMKHQYKQAQRYNSHKREFFLKRWFKGVKKPHNNPQRKNRE